ncbi:MAG: toll/interleukin-1 receptor domain-containing protein [Acidobacteriota bacterium]|jgi:tetratricopeptide (TPR) repeat protein
MKDFFISFSSADRAWAEWIGWQLREAGYSVELQGWTWGPGANFPLEMDRAARETHRTLAVLSPSFLGSRYTRAEWAAAFREDPEGRRRRLVPVKVRECDPNGLLGSIVSIDLTALADTESARRALLEGLEQPEPPDEEPAFPNAGTGRGQEGSETLGLPARRPPFPGALPPRWNVPHRRNPHFAGREELLAKLEEALGPEGAPDGAATRTQMARTQAIRGLGGVGKTQLALEYVYRHAAEYDTVWWVRAEDSETLTRDLAALAAELGLADPARPDPQAEVAAVRRWLETHGGWLLVFDNAEDPAGLEPYLPRGRTGPVLITSRRSDWDGVAAPFPVDVLPLEEAAAFLLERTAPDSAPNSESNSRPESKQGSRTVERPEGDDLAAARSLAEALGCLPLALEQAGAFIREDGALTLAGYEELFRNRRRELLARGAPRAHREEPVETTWDLSFERLEEEAPEAGDLLRLLSFFAPEDLPLGLIPEHPELLPEPLATAAADRLRWHDVLAAARRLSLLEIEAGVAGIHRLVQAVLRDRLGAEEERLWAGAAVRLLNAGYGYERNDLATWEPALRLLPHVAAATGAAEGVGVASEATARLLNDAGLQLLDRGVLDRARDHLERALAIGEAVYGPEHPNVATLASNLAMILQACGDLAGAEKLSRTALAIHEAIHGSQHPHVATGANNLGLILKARGDLAGAEELTRRALAIDEAFYGPEHPNVAIRASNLATLLRDHGDLAGAEELTRRALVIGEAVYGSEHPSMATLVNNLVTILQARGDLAGAEELARRALAIFETTYGPKHPTVAICRNNLAFILEDQGHMDVAEEEYRRAVEIAEGVLGAEHPDTKLCAANLTRLLERRGER